MMPCLIGYFRVAFCLHLKTSPSAKPFKWKLVWFTWKRAWDRVKRIIIWMVHVDSSWNRGKRLTRWRSLPCYFPRRYTRIISPPANLTWCRHQSNLNNCHLGAKPKYKAVIYKVGRWFTIYRHTVCIWPMKFLCLKNRFTDCQETAGFKSWDNKGHIQTVSNFSVSYEREYFGWYSIHSRLLWCSFQVNFLSSSQNIPCFSRELPTRHFDN